MLAKNLSIVASLALAVKAWAKGRLWTVEKERRASDRRLGAEAAAARLKIALGDALAAGRVSDAAAIRRQLQTAEKEIKA